MNLRGMKCLDSLWQLLWGIKCGKCGDSVGHQMPFKMTACPRHGGHSHEDWRIPVGFRSRQKGVSHPEEMGKERSVNTIFLHVPSVTFPQRQKAMWLLGLSQWDGGVVLSCP